MTRRLAALLDREPVPASRGLRSRAARRGVLAVFAAAGAAYLAWRAAATLGAEPGVFAVLFLLAEAHLYASSLGFYALLSPPGAPGRAAPPPGAEPVDVLVCTYREDAALVRATALAARDLRGPHRTWICDDGARPEVEALARDIGVSYLSRPVNTHYKAGNLNHALSRTQAPLVAVLDADHVPREDWLERVTGHFGDPRVAFVQIPQVAYNLDAFGAALSRGGRLWQEPAVFHHRLQPGADRHGCALFVGTGAVLRRAALESVGGFAVESVTEDVLTAMRLHAAGWGSVYVDEPLALLLAPQTPVAWARQRLRWAQGAMQILRLENPLLKRGLGAAQRWIYFQSLAGFLSAWPMLVLLCAPAAFLALGVNPVVADPVVALPLVGAHVLLDVAAYSLLVAPHGNLLRSEGLRMAAAALNLRATLRLLRPRGLAFATTPKGAQRGVPLSLWAVPAAVAAANLAALGIALLRAPAEPGAALACGISGAFALWFAAQAALVLGQMARHRRSSGRHAFPVGLGSAPAGAPGLRVLALDVDGAVAEPAGLAPGAAATVDLACAGLGAVPARASRAEGLLRLDFEPPLPPAARDRLLAHLLREAAPRLLASCHACPPPGPQAPVHVPEPTEGLPALALPVPVREGS